MEKITGVICEETNFMATAAKVDGKAYHLTLRPTRTERVDDAQDLHVAFLSPAPARTAAAAMKPAFIQRSFERYAPPPLPI